MNLNIVAVIVAGLASYFLGVLWYSPLLFGKMWVKLMQLDKKKSKNVRAKSIVMTIGVSLVSNLVTAYVMAMVMSFGNVVSVTTGVQIGFWLWLGFIAIVTLGGVLWEGKSLKLYILNNVYNLLSLILMGAILSTWK